jgi:hypothetical protein
VRLILNITLQGVSADHAVDFDVEPRDEDVKRVAIELTRSGNIPGLQVAGLSDRAFDDYVVDRFDTPEGGRRLFLRPKVPFGAVPVAVRARR